MWFAYHAVVSVLRNVDVNPRIVVAPVRGTILVLNVTERAWRAAVQAAFQAPLAAGKLVLCPPQSTCGIESPWTSVCGWVHA